MAIISSYDVTLVAICSEINIITVDNDYNGKCLMTATIWYNIILSIWK